MSWNIRSTVRGAIQTLNPDTPGAVYVSSGRTNVGGILTPTFNTVTAMLQVQAQPSDAVNHKNGLEYNGTYYRVYAFGDFSAVDRPLGKGGDVILMGGHYYYISQTLEQWPDWCLIEATTQLNATDLAALLASLRNGRTP